MSDLNVDQEDLKSCTTNIASEDAKVGPSQQEFAISDVFQPRNQIQESFKYKMYVVCREFCTLVLVLFSVFLLKSTPKASKSPNSFPFFPEGSFVKDWYYGQLSEAIELASESDLAFLMFYAPWDAESQAVKHEFDKVAQHMHTQIHFAAINCWHPGSECRHQYSKLHSWPVLMAYPVHGRGIQYRGPRKFEYMMRFLQMIINPFTRIHNLAEIGAHGAFRDAVVVGYINSKLGSEDYGIFYSSALRYFERDPVADLQFLILTGNYDAPLLELYLWNETLIYQGFWKPELISSWIAENILQVSLWTTLPGSKSQLLSNYLQPGPALILFTPRNPLYIQNDYYSVLHDVALDYYNCDNNLGIKIKRVFLSISRKQNRLEYNRLKNKCLFYKQKKEKKFPKIVTYDLHSIWLNDTCNIQKFDSICTKPKAESSKCSKSFSKKINSLLETEIIEERKVDVNKTENFLNKYDTRSAKNLQYLYEQEKCNYFRVAYELQPALFAPLPNKEAESLFNLTGLACSTNFSFSILALDSDQYHFFAENLGIDILNRPDKTAVVILNPKMETHHVMQTSFSAENLKQFIFEFRKGMLRRTLDSLAYKRQFTHLYEFQDIDEYNASRNMQFISELNTSNFLPKVMQPEMAVIAFYYTKTCSFCSSVSYILLSVARILHPIKNIQFVRIDGGTQALPWEFSMHQFPSILFFPVKRKSESRVFPQNVPITVSNILSFVLANIDSNTKLEIMWTLCNQKLHQDEMQKCFKIVRKECVTMIGKLLRVYRFSRNSQHRSILLKQLQHLRSLHFLLTNPTNKKEFQNQLTLLRKIDITSNKVKYNASH